MNEQTLAFVVVLVVLVAAAIAIGLAIIGAVAGLQIPTILR